MSLTETRPSTARPRRSTLDRASALRLAATEYDRYLAQLRSLDDSDWSRRTDCPAWDVRAMAAHNLGMAEMAASLPEFVRQLTAASRRPEVGVDALTAHQVRSRAALTPAELVGRYAAVRARAVRGRARRAAVLGRLTMPERQETDGVAEAWTFGYLFETILTRDTWMHRVDTARATGHPLHLTAEHDGRLLADVVAEWAGRHRRPFRLELTGAAGGSFASCTDGEAHTLDAVEFARVLSGRASGPGLLAVHVPF